jgi:hypothetical protein
MRREGWFTTCRDGRQTSYALTALSATRMDLLESRALSRAADREMAFRCWDLDDLGRDYVELIRAYQQLPAAAELAALPGTEALRRQVELVACAAAQGVAGAPRPRAIHRRPRRPARPGRYIRPGRGAESRP